MTKLIDAIICDIDGTLVNIDKRLPYLTKDPIDWDSFLDPENIKMDSPIVDTIKIIKVLSKTFPIVSVTGRNEGIRKATEEQLNQYLGFVPHKSMLHMRKDGDHSLDLIIKANIYEKKIKPEYNIIGIFEDKTSVVEMWRSLGLNVFQVDPPKAPDGF